MEKLVIIAFVLLIVQGLLTYFQIKSYKNRVSELKKYGLVGVGTQKGGISAGNITILVTDKNGNIARCEKMEGITVFARFKEIRGLEGMHISELKEKLNSDPKSNKKGKRNAMFQAIEGLEARLAKV